MLVSIIIPTYHSSKFIEKTLKEIEKFSHEVDFSIELLVVDDGSLDGTYEAILDLSKKLTLDIKVLQFFTNRGQFQAVMAALPKASGKYVVTMDDDLEYHPREILKLLNGMKENPEYDVVIGCSEARKTNFFRKVGSSFFQYISSLFLEKKNEIRSTCFRLFTKEFKEKLEEYRYFEPVLGPLIFSSTRRIKNVTVKHTKGLRKSNYSFLNLVRLFLKSIQGFSGGPIKYIGALGLVISFFSMLVVGGIIFQHFTGFPYPIKSPGWISLIVSLWFLSGITILAISIVGQYVYLNRLEILRGPNYQLRNFYEKKKEIEKNSQEEKSAFSTD